MKTITITLSDDEVRVVDFLCQAVDPSGSVKLTSLAKGCLMEGVCRSAKRADIGIPFEWLTTEALKRYLAHVC